jgi:plasmid stabilization system protein ParE
VSVRVTRSRLVENDLVEISSFFGRDNAAAAHRLLEACEAVFNLIASMPEMGPRAQYRMKELRGARKAMVPGFDKYWVVYRATASGIEIARVLHSSRNLTVNSSARS